MDGGRGRRRDQPRPRPRGLLRPPSATGPDGNLYQLPDQQFANLYWFRKDWFDNADYQAQFREKYGYDLGVPLNWSAYEDIAEFFTEHVGEIDGTRIYGHMDYGKRAPDLGWRMTDAWLSMAGAADLGVPNGVPVDEWGIRMEEGTCNPVGASVERGGATNSRPAVYAIEKWDEWLRAYAPPGAADLDFYQSLPALSQGNVAQQIFWYTAFVPRAWFSPRPRATTPWTRTACRCGGWRRRPTAPTGRRACSRGTRTSAPGRSSR
jgi:glycerol transport system substrate-binding protein